MREELELQAGVAAPIGPLAVTPSGDLQWTTESRAGDKTKLSKSRVHLRLTVGCRSKIADNFSLMAD